VFDPEGDFVTQYSVGADDAILTSMSVDRDGALFAVAGGRLYHYDGATGELLGQIEYGDFPHFDLVVTTADGSLVTAYNSAGTDNLIRFDRNFDVDLEVFDFIEAITGDSETTMHIAVDGSGAMYVLGGFHEAVFRFSPDGVFQTQFGGEGDEPGQFTAPGAIALDRQSRVYVSDFKGIQVFDANGRYLAVFDVPDGGYIHGLTVDDDNFLYAVSNNSKVYKFALNP
jgi:sugar lactone lactonase YvrE